MGGWPPLVVAFQHYYDKEAILNRCQFFLQFWGRFWKKSSLESKNHVEKKVNIKTLGRADMLERTGILITEDMSRRAISILWYHIIIIIIIYYEQASQIDINHTISYIIKVKIFHQH